MKGYLCTMKGGLQLKWSGLHKGLRADRRRRGRLRNGARCFRCLPRGANRVHDDYLQIAFGVIGAVYLVVRGLDNATRGVRDARERNRRVEDVAAAAYRQSSLLVEGLRHILLDRQDISVA